MYRDHTVGAVIPAYNEEGFVGDVIDDLPDFLDRAYVVDDGSTDDTWAEIRRHAAARNGAEAGDDETLPAGGPGDSEGGRTGNPSPGGAETVQTDGPDDLVVPIRHAENRGVGGAIKTGYLRAREEEIDVTVVLGGDDQMDPAELTRYLDPIVDGVADYTKGNRFSRPEDYAEMPRFRLVGNVVLSYLTKVASGYWSTMDSQNGYTAISLSALERTDVEGMYEYYGYCNDLLVRLNAAGVRVADVPRSSDYAYTEGWKSHIDYREYIPRVSVMLARGFGWRLRRKYLLEGFDPLAPLYLLGLGTVGSSIAGFLVALVDPDGDAGPWFLSAVVGTLVFLYAAMRDHADNEHLEVQVDPAESGAEADDRPDVVQRPTERPDDRDEAPAAVHANGSGADGAGGSPADPDESPDVGVPDPAPEPDGGVDR